MSTVSSNLNKPSSIFEVEQKSAQCSFFSSELGFTQLATEGQKKLREPFLERTTTILPLNCNYPPLKFTLKDICHYLKKSLGDENLLEKGPFFIGGVGTFLMMNPEYALEYSDIDVCFNLRVPAYESVQNMFIDFCRFHLNLLKNSNRNKKNQESASILLDAYNSNSLIAANYLYKKNMLTNHHNEVGGSLFKLGLFEFKFFHRMICRQNVFKSDGFRFPLFDDKIFCVDVDSLCTKEEFDVAVLAAQKRHCLISKPEEAQDYLFKIVQKTTQGFEFPESEMLRPGLEQFAKTFFSGKIDLLGPKLHKHQQNHYPNNPVGVFFDFINFLMYISQNQHHKERISQCAIFAESWLKEAQPTQKSSLTGQFALLIAKFPEKTELLINLVQGFLLHQLIKKNPALSGYRFAFDPSQIRYSLAVKTQKTNYLRIQNSPKTLAQKFLQSWNVLEEQKSEVQLFLTTCSYLFGFHLIDFSERSKAIVIQDLWMNLESSALTANPLQKEVSTENYLPFYNFILKEFGSLVNRPQLELRILEKSLALHLKEALRFKQKAIAALISVVLAYLKALEKSDLSKISQGLMAIVEEKELFNPRLKKELAKALLKILDSIKSSIKPQQLLVFSKFFVASSAMEIFSLQEQQGHLDFIFETCDFLMNFENFNDLLIAFSNLKEIQLAALKGEGFEKELSNSFMKLSMKLRLALTLLLQSFSKISISDFRIACNSVSILNELRSLGLDIPLKETQELMFKIINHATESEAPLLMHPAGVMAVKMLELGMVPEEHFVSVLYLAKKLSLLSAEKIEIEPEIALEEYLVISSRIFQLFLETLKEKNVLSAISPKGKIAFFNALLHVDKECTFSFIGEELQKMDGVSEELETEFLICCRNFCQKIAMTQDRNLMRISCSLFTSLKTPDPHIFLHLLKGFTTVTEESFFKFAEKHLKDERLLKNKLLIEHTILCYRYFAEIATHLALEHKKCGRIENYRQFSLLFKGFDLFFSSKDPTDRDLIISNTKMVEFFSEQDTIEGFEKTFEIINTRKTVNVMESFFVILNALLKRSNAYVCSTEELEQLKKMVSRFFKNHSRSFQTAETELYLDFLRKFFETGFSESGRIGFILLEAFFHSEDLKIKQSDSKKLAAPYSQKIQRNISQHLLKMGKLSFEHFEENFLPSFFSIFNKAIGMLSARYQQIVLEFIKIGLQKRYKEIFDWIFIPKTEMAKKVFLSTFLNVKEFLTIYARFDPDKARLLVKKWITHAICEEAKRSSPKNVANSDIPLAAEELLEIYFSLKLFEKTTLEWGKMGVASGKTLKLAQTEFFDLGSKVIPWLCNIRKDGVLQKAMRLLEHCTEMIDFTSADKISILFSCYYCFHQRGILDAALYHEEDAYMRLLNPFLNLLENVSKKGYGNTGILFANMGTVRAKCLHLLASPMLLQLAVKGGIEQMLTQNPDHLVGLNFEGGKTVKALIVPCLEIFTYCDSAEMKMALDEKTQEILLKLLIALIDGFSKSNFLRDHIKILKPKFSEILTELSTLSTYLMPPDVAAPFKAYLQLAHERLDLVASVKVLTGERKTKVKIKL